MKVNRHICREFALQTLYTWEFFKRNKSLVELLRLNNGHFFDYNEKKLEFALIILEGIEKNILSIESTIVKYAPEWPLEKISTLDKCTLYIGIFELLHSTDVPDVVAINESVELAKNYGSDTSSRFVNGVLNTIYQKVKLSQKD